MTKVNEVLISVEYKLGKEFSLLYRRVSTILDSPNILMSFSVSSEICIGSERVGRRSNLSEILEGLTGKSLGEYLRHPLVRLDEKVTNWKFRKFR